MGHHTALFVFVAILIQQCDLKLVAELHTHFVGGRPFHCHVWIQEVE